ncbi:glycosyl hydrolase catalytic core-domain-containing protein [Trametes elegans]|nr:glycosyl hydrolase catalytic core-domain-containing protein [Trametes elegans]
MPSRIVSIFILIALFPRRATAIPAEPRRVQNSAVSNASKAGLAWANGDYNDIGQFLTTGKVQWYYTWSPSPVRTDIEFVPMLWGGQQTADWDNNINRTIQERHITHALGFNEPEIAGQANITPADAAALWKAHIEPLKGLGVRLGAPASSGAPQGKQWLLQWFDACQGGCTVDFMSLHWYNVNSTAFVEYLQDYHDTFQKPVWVTEWACQNFSDENGQCSLQDIVNLMNATQTFMDSTHWVERYAWFGAMENLQGVNQENALMSAEGYITTLGKQYIGAVTPNVSSGYQPGVVHGGKGVSTPISGPNTSDAMARRLSPSLALLAALIALGALS